MSKELKLKILNVLKNELEHERMIRSNVLRSRVIAGHDESFSVNINTLSEARITNSFPPYIILNPKYRNSDLKKLVEEL